MRSLRKFPNYTSTSIELNGEERVAQVYFDVQPAEPDVGIFHTSIEIESICVMNDSPVAMVRARMLRLKPQYDINVTDLVTDQHQRIIDEINEQLCGWDDYG